MLLRIECFHQSLLRILSKLFSLCFSTRVFPLGNISIFNTSHSIEILPGPVNKRLIDIAAISELVSIVVCLSSGPPTKLSDDQTARVAPNISITKMEVVILVDTPTIRNIPPMTSNRAIGTTSSGEAQGSQNNPD